MDAAYSWQSHQVGVPPHPLLLRSFREYETKDGKQEPLLVLGARESHETDPPVRDADLVGVCLVVRAMSRTSSLPGPLVRLDLTGELISCSGVRTIAAVLQVSSSLCSVLLRRTHVGDDGAAALGAALSCSMLQELDLGESAVTDAGVRYLVRGMQVHGAPPSFKILLLDGNAIGDAGAIEVITLVEEGSSLSTLSLHPALPRFLSKEVEAALQVACELSRVNLEYKGHPVTLDALASLASPRARAARAAGALGRPVKEEPWLNLHLKKQHPFFSSFPEHSRTAESPRLGRFVGTAVRGPAPRPMSRAAHGHSGTPRRRLPRSEQCRTCSMSATGVQRRCLHDRFAESRGGVASTWLRGWRQRSVSCGS